METSFFWDGNRNTGDFGDCGPYDASALAKLLAVVSEDRTGVTSGLVVTASMPAARSVKVSAGRMIVAGQLYANTTDLTLALDENASGSPRIDSLVVETDWTGKTMRLKVVKGTPAASPSAPALVQIAGSLWQERLANVQVASGYTTVVESTITRTRRWARADFPGQMAMMGGTPVGAGWLACNGSAVSRTTYVDLFDAIGTQFGAGDGATTFNLPDFRGRSPLGLDNLGGAAANRVTNANADVVGGAGGAETHTLTVAEIPSHSHSISYNNNNAGSTHGIDFSANSDNSHSTTTGNQGGGGSHNNMHPWLAIPIYIRS